MTDTFKNRALQVRGWLDYYETAETRKRVKVLRWLPLPNKHDGKGYRRVASVKNRCEVFSGFVLILQIASKCPQRGLLVDEDGPILPEDMALMTGFPVEIFHQAIEQVTESKVGWLEWVEWAGQTVGIAATPTATADEQTAQSASSGSNAGSNAGIAAGNPDIPAPPDGITARHAAKAADSGPEDREDMEDMEGREREARAHAGEAPSIGEVEAMAGKLGMPKSEAEGFWRHYDAQGWVNGNGIRISSWTSKLHRWKAKWEREGRMDGVAAKGEGGSGAGSGGKGSGNLVKSIAQADSVIKELTEQLKVLQRKLRVYDASDSARPVWRDVPEVAEKITQIEGRIKEVRHLKTGLPQ